jgi:hypothetical protein
MNRGGNTGRMKHMSVEYKHFAQHYIEMFDILVEHQLKVNELKELNELEESDEPIPIALLNELTRHHFIVQILEDTALKIYGKNHNELFSDAVALEPKNIWGKK